jgi:hypothetical protein
MLTGSHDYDLLTDSSRNASGFPDIHVSVACSLKNVKKSTATSSADDALSHRMRV